MTQMDLRGTDVAAPPVFLKRDTLEETGLVLNWDAFVEETGLTTTTAVPTHDPHDTRAAGGWRTGGSFWITGRGLRSHVKIRVDVSAPDQYTALEPSTGIFGVGAGAAEAVEDLRQALVDHRDILTASEALSEDLQAQLRLLKQYLLP